MARINRAGRDAGLLCVISSPSGGGKTSVIKRLLADGADYGYSVSATTRPRRSSEVDGEHYHFLSDDAFDARIAAGDFIEWAVVHGFRYGTLKGPIENMLDKGRIVLLDIDVIGGINVRKAFPDRSLLIFLTPVSLAVLKKRLRNRNSESPEEIAKRLKRLPMEMRYKDEYDIKIVNDVFDVTVKNVEEAILKYQAKMEA
jgi:guanylate kinase